jgi:GAF domain-containing protein/HAMP domain-containing protein
MIAGLSLLALLILVAGGFSFWQLTTLRSAILELEAGNEQLTLTLDVAQRLTSLILIATSDAEGRMPGKFAREVQEAVDALRSVRGDLETQVSNLAEDSPTRTRTDRVIAGVDRSLASAERAIHHAESEAWFEVDSQVALLSAGYSDIRLAIDDLLDQTSLNRVEAETLANEAMVRMVTVSAPLFVSALLVGAAVVFLTIRNVTAGVVQLTGAAGRLAEGSFEERIPIVRRDELGQLAQSFNAMAEELQSAYGKLEQEVAERTRDLTQRTAQLEAAAHVARDAAEIRDPAKLLQETVELISERFGFYHAGIFLLDEQHNAALLRAASSEGGRRMLARGHQLGVGETGIVGYVAGTGEPRIALDVGQDAQFFDNPDLPETRSEMAVPLKVRGQVIGVLDVQSEAAQAFSEEDVAMLQTLADQVAVALENARLLVQSQAALEATRRAYGELSREAWVQLLRARSGQAHRSTNAGVTSLRNDQWSLEAEQAWLEGRTIQSSQDGPDARYTLVVPIRIRDDVIGVLDTYKASGAGEWTAEEIELLETLANQLSAALESAQLYESVQRRAAQEQLSAEIGGQLRGSLDPDAILKMMVRELGHSLGAQSVSIELTGPADQDADAQE